MRLHVLLLLVCGLGYGGEPIRITVTDSFGGSQASFQAIAQEISAIVAEKFRSPPPINVPILCISGSDVPETLTFSGQIVVRLTAKEQLWAQLAFQLGHELGHVYLGPLRTNGFIEALATAMSLEVLDELSERWPIVPAIPGTSAWAHNFAKNRVENEDIELAKLPDIKDLVARHDWDSIRYYLRLRNRDMQQLTRAAANSEEGRALQMLAAMSLRSRPLNWSRLSGFAHTSSVQPVQEGQGKAIYDRIQPELLNPDLCRMGLGCSTALVAAEYKKQPLDGPTIEFLNTWYAIREVDPKNALKTLNSLCKKRPCIGSLTIR